MEQIREQIREQMRADFEYGLQQQITALVTSLGIAEEYYSNPYDSSVVRENVSRIEGYLASGLYLDIIHEEYRVLNKELRRWVFSR